MLKAGTAKLFAFATSRIALPVVSIADCLLMDRLGLYRTGSEAADESPLEEEEQDKDRDGAQDAHGHHLVPLVRVLTHQELDADGHGPHVVGAGERQREEVFV